MAPMAAVLLPLHDPQIPLGLSGRLLYASGCLLLFRVLCGLHVNGSLDPTLLLVSGRSVGRVGPCVSFPKFPGTFLCLGAAFGGLALRASENYNYNYNYLHTGLRPQASSPPGLPTRRSLS